MIFSFFFPLWASDFEVDYESEENAQVVYSALAVDKEVLFRDAPIPTYFSPLKLLLLDVAKFYVHLQLQPDKVKRQMSVSNGKLFV